MPQFIDRTAEAGAKFNRLTLEPEYRITKRGLMTKRTQVIWKFKCECGNEVWGRYDDVSRGAVKSCGCQRGHGHKKEYGLSSKKRLYRSYKRSAKVKNRVFEFTFEQFVTMTSSKCYYCNCPPSSIQKADGNNGDYIYNGIDRIDNDVGYVKENCTTACAPCNNAKKHLPQDEFLRLVEAIYNNRIKDK